MSEEELSFYNDPPSGLLIARDPEYCWCTTCGTGPYLVDRLTGEPLNCYKCGA